MYLVLLGPPFAGSDRDYLRLSQVTGMLGYDLRTKLRPHNWGLVRSFAESEDAETLAQELRSVEYRAVVVPGQVGRDRERRIVTLVTLEMTDAGVELTLKGRTMTIPRGALLLQVRGEAQTTPSQGARTHSSSGHVQRPSSSQAMVLPSTVPTGSYPALDVHFITVPWIARLDSRSFVFPEAVAMASGNARKLDALAELLQERAGPRVDRGQKTSSVASFARQICEQDVPFDVYSRLIGEAERSARKI